jgi:hypothetical protein
MAGLVLHKGRASAAVIGWPRVLRIGAADTKRKEL